MATNADEIFKPSWCRCDLEQLEFHDYNPRCRHKKIVKLYAERDSARNTAALLEDECAMLSKELSAHSTRLGDSK